MDIIKFVKVQKTSRILILSHFYKRTLSGGGPPQDIRNFFLKKVKLIYYIEHPFPYSDEHRSSLSIYKNGKLKEQFFSIPIYGPSIIYYIADAVFTFYFVLRTLTLYDLCIALDNLNTFSVIPFRKFGLIKKLVFYTIDYNPVRFNNKFLNSIYHFLDRISCYSSDTIWVLSPRMVFARKANGVNDKKTAPSITLPMGANLKNIKLQSINKINQHQIVFVGALLEKQGLQIVIEAMPKLVEKIPNAKLVIVGKGEYEKKLKELVSKLKVDKNVQFKGFIEKQTDLEKFLCKCAVGVATYVTRKDNYTFFTDPGKPKLYLGCGLPVIITDVPEISKEIENKKAGMIVKYSSESVKSALIKLLSDYPIYKQYRENAILLSRKYDTNNLVRSALERTN